MPEAGASQCWLMGNRTGDRRASASDEGDLALDIEEVGELEVMIVCLHLCSCSVRELWRLIG